MFKKVLLVIKKLLSFFKSSNKQNEKNVNSKNQGKTPPRKIESTRIGELGEYKINIQLDQLPKECKYLSDIMILNPKSKTGYSQIDHVVFSPFGLFVIETKNYNGEIKGKRNDKIWIVSNRFKMYNPLRQNYGHVKVLEEILSDFKNLTFVSIVTFTMRCRFSVDPDLRKIESNQLIIYDVELSDYIKRKFSRWNAEGTQPTLSQQDTTTIYETVHKSNITDPNIRRLHIEKVKDTHKTPEVHARKAHTKSPS